MKGLIAVVATALLAGEIVGWFQGRSEVGARALGSRSILADPRVLASRIRANVVKQREQWRPLAPSVLAEHADEWFDSVPECGSPYMSFIYSEQETSRTLPPPTVRTNRLQIPRHGCL